MIWRRKQRVPAPSRVLRDARAGLAERKRETPRIKAMVAEWRRIREDNHFADAIQATFRGGKP